MTVFNKKKYKINQSKCEGRSYKIGEVVKSNHPLYLYINCLKVTNFLF